VASAPLRRALAGGVTVEGDDDAFDLHVLQPQVLLAREGGTHRSDNVRDACLMRGDRVEVALDDHRGPFAPDRGPRDVERIERRALVEERRVRRGDVLGLLVGAHRPAAESDDLPARVLDRHDEPAAEPVVHTAVAGTQQAGGDPFGLGEALLLEVDEQPVPQLRRVAETELLDRLWAPASPRQVGRGALALIGRAQALSEVEECRLHQPAQPVLAFLVFRSATYELDAGTLRQHPQSLALVEVVHLLHEREDVALLVAAEAVVVPSLGVHLERRRLLRVERAEAFVDLSRSLEGHALADKSDDVDALLDRVEVTWHVRSPCGAGTR